ncbi:MAG: DnaK suppressor protein [Verrucomicrobiales bacterium]|jgi:DnaK suppressor protein
MTANQISEIHERLLAERSRLVEEVASLRRKDTIASLTTGAEAAERADLEVERAFEHRHELDDTHLLEKIDLALQRLENGSYEFCANCSSVIPEERLLAKPSVSLCHACQQRKEDGTIVETSH